jgi:hypothetical protein
MRILFILLLVLVTGFLFLNSSKLAVSQQKPVFLRTDAVTAGHYTEIDIRVQSVCKPVDTQLGQLKTDYNAIWAHLNHLYATNDVEVGKEYYTRNWFNAICRNYKGVQQQQVARTDTRHELNIINWDRDGLVCTAVDSNVVLQYQFPGMPRTAVKQHIAMVLLYQGDHWRIDAMKILSTAPADYKKQ